jgi:L-2-hydroxyglutarate oxidase LhgO
LSTRVGITVIGAGVVGCAVAMELAGSGEEVLVLERNPGVVRGENQSSRNSGVIHAGLYYDRATRPLKAALCAEGNRLLYAFCDLYDVPALKCGKLVVAVKESDIPVLRLYLARALENNVPAHMVDGRQAAEMEPQVKARAALYLPTSGIIDSTSLVYKLHVVAGNHGAQFLTETTLESARPRSEGIELTVRYRDGAQDAFLSDRVVNSAGLYSDDVARMADPASTYQIDPLRGEAAKFYRTRRAGICLRGMNVYPTPEKVETRKGTYFTVGLHLTPTLEKGPSGQLETGAVVTVCPLNMAAAHKEDYGGDFQPMGLFQRRVAPFFPDLKEEDLEPHQVGIQARLVGHQDWVIEFSRADGRWLNLLGVDSPGLTGSLAIAGKVRRMLMGSGSGAPQPSGSRIQP